MIMKGLTYISKAAFALILALGFFVQVQAQGPEGTIKQVQSAIVAGDADAMASHFNSSVEITIPGAENSYSKQQGTFVMADFFKKYKPSGFEIIHQGHSGATYYATGSTTTSGGNFDTNIFVKKTGESFLITQIRFEAE